MKPFPNPCERHAKTTWLARVPDGEECFGCFIRAKQSEALEAAAEVADNTYGPWDSSIDPQANVRLIARAIAAEIRKLQGESNG